MASPSTNPHGASPNQRTSHSHRVQHHGTQHHGAEQTDSINHKQQAGQGNHRGHANTGPTIDINKPAQQHINSDNINQENICHEKPCRHNGCQAAGLYPAPQSKQQPRPYLWFCKEHIVAYNQRWDWYQGMTAAQIVEDQLADLTWRRPTYSLQQGRYQERVNIVLDDPLQMLYKQWSPTANPKVAHGGPTSAPHHGTANKNRQHKGNGTGYAVFIKPDSKAGRALHQLGLTNPITYDEIKTHYRQLALRLHPDRQPRITEGTNAQNIAARKTAEQKRAQSFQQFTAAYQELKTWFQQRGAG